MDRIQRKKRVKISAEVYIVRTGRAEGIDLSQDGMYIYYKHPFVIGSMIDVSFKIDDRDIKATAKVIHSQPGIGMGVQFMDLSEGGIEQIHEYLEHTDAVVECRLNSNDEVET